MAIAPGSTLADYIIPAQSSRNQQLVRDGALVVGFSLLIALSAQATIHLPFTLVPITLQTLAVLLTGATLGSKRGALAVLLYLAEGACGLPVFANWSATAELIGVTAGYLWAFPVAAFMVGLLCERGLDRSYLTSVLAMLPGTIICYGIGAAWLGIVLHHSAPVAIMEGVVPFIAGDLIKMLIAAALLPTAWQIVRTVKSNHTNK